MRVQEMTVCAESGCLSQLIFTTCLLANEGLGGEQGRHELVSFTSICKVDRALEGALMLGT